jgi:hypothetical protein
VDAVALGGEGGVDADPAQRDVGVAQGAQAKPHEQARGEGRVGEGGWELADAVVKRLTGLPGDQLVGAWEDERRDVGALEAAAEAAERVPGRRLAGAGT